MAVDDDISVRAAHRSVQTSVLLEWATILVLLSAFALLTARGDWLWRIDQTLYDAAISSLERPADDRIVIVGIDDESLSSIGKWPWRRAVHATLINNLTQAGAKAIAFDVALSDTDSNNIEGDVALAAAIKANGRVVLPVNNASAGAQGRKEQLPADGFAAVAARLGHITVDVDPDGIVRSVYLRAGSPNPTHSQLALAVLQVAEPLRFGQLDPLPGVRNPDNVKHRANHLVTLDAAASAPWRLDSWYQIPFVGPPASFKTVPYIDVLMKKDLNRLKDKIVIVGAATPNLGDAYPTPVSGQLYGMMGAEIHANVIQSLLEGRDLRRAPAWVAGATACIVIFILLFSYLWLSPRVSIGFTFVMMALTLIGCSLLFRGAQIWVSPAVTLIATAFTYPLWSWRRLEATQRYLLEELERLRAEPGNVPGDAPSRALASHSESQSRAASRFATPFTIEFGADVVQRRIDEVREATERLRNLRRFVSDSLDSLPEATLVCDRSGTVTLANSVAIKLLSTVPSTDTLVQGTTAADTALANTVTVVGAEIFRVLRHITREDLKSWQQLFSVVETTGAAASVEAKWGDQKEFLAQAGPLYDAKGRLNGIILVLVDIFALRQSERRRDETLRFLSHDMRSPQASILTLLELYREDPDDMPVEKLTNRIHRYATRTLVLADDFLRLAKAERSTPKDFILLELNELLQDAVEEAWTLSSAKGIEITVADNAFEDGAFIEGDRDLFTRVLLNLLSNAVKYSPPDTAIHCAIERVGDNWEIKIADQGYGIAEEDLPKLFARFARLKHDAQPDEEGIGLGLVFVKTVIVSHRGEIRVESRVFSPSSAIGEHGTTFIVTMPAADAQ